jgi:DNA repair protein RadC
VAFEPRPGAASYFRLAGPACATDLAPVVGFGSADLHVGSLFADHRGGDARSSILGDGHGPLVFADIAARHRDLPQRPHSREQVDHLAALLAPLSGRLAPDHAIELLRKFGSIAGIAAARKRELAEVFGPDSALPAHIAAVRRLLRAGLREHVVRRPLDPQDPAMIQWILTHFSGLRHEEMLVVWADSSGRLLDYQTLATGHSEQVEFGPELLFRRAIIAGAKQALLAHNHPSGVAHPSDDDIVSTRRIVRDGRLLGISLLDHLIVGGSRVFSMQRAGLL